MILAVQEEASVAMPQEGKVLAFPRSAQPIFHPGCTSRA